jgi:hypothetical protein
MTQPPSRSPEALGIDGAIRMTNGLLSDRIAAKLAGSRRKAAVFVQRDSSTDSIC